MIPRPFIKHLEKKNKVKVSIPKKKFFSHREIKALFKSK